MLRCIAIALAVCFTSASAQAAVEATSLTVISNFNVNSTSALTPIFAPVNSYVFDVRLDGFGPQQTVAAQGTLDGPLTGFGAAIGTTVTENAFPLHGTVAPLPYVFADSDGAGNILAGNATATTQSSIGSTASPALTGLGVATDQLTVQTVRVGAGGATVSFSFDAVVDLDVTNGGSTPPLVANAAASYSITVNGTGPNAGSDSYTSSTDANFLPLIRAIDAPADDSYDFAGSIQSNTFFLGAGDYIVTISQTNDVSLEYAIPEPTTVAVWSLLGVGACAARRRRA